MHFSSLYLASCLALGVICNLSGFDADIKRADISKIGTMVPPIGGRTLQATVTGYDGCLTDGMACGLTGSPGKDPTAAMSAYLIPSYGQGTCGSCSKLGKLRELKYHKGHDVLPTIGGPLKSPKGDGMVDLIKNSCAPGKNQYEKGAVGQCTQTNGHPHDNLSSNTVLDLCRDFSAVEMLWGTKSPGMVVADIEEVNCSEWSGHVRHREMLS